MEVPRKQILCAFVTTITSYALNIGKIKRWKLDIWNTTMTSVKKKARRDVVLNKTPHKTNRTRSSPEFSKILSDTFFHHKSPASSEHAFIEDELRASRESTIAQMSEHCFVLYILLINESVVVPRWSTLLHAKCVRDEIGQATKPTPVRDGCAWSLTPTLCAARKWCRSSWWGSTGWRKEGRELSELDVKQRHQIHRRRMRVRDDYEWRGHNFILSHGVRSVLTKKNVLWHAPRNVFCVRFGELRLTRLANVTNLKKDLDDCQRSRILSWTFSSSFLLKFLGYTSLIISGLTTDHPASCVVVILSKSKTTSISSTRMLTTIEKRKMRLRVRVLLWSPGPNFRLAIPGTREF